MQPLKSEHMRGKRLVHVAGWAVFKQLNKIGCIECEKKFTNLSDFLPASGNLTHFKSLR